jgi:hypothetical protein
MALTIKQPIRYIPVQSVALPAPLYSVQLPNRFRATTLALVRWLLSMVCDLTFSALLAGGRGLQWLLTDGVVRGRRAVRRALSPLLLLDRSALSVLAEAAGFGVLLAGFLTAFYVIGR